jgi:ABC-type nitrate/sulfonate/bicarbonate transport system ATPase subunit
MKGLLVGDIKVLGPKFLVGVPFAKYLAQDFDLMPYTTVAENVGKFCQMVLKP